MGRSAYQNKVGSFRMHSRRADEAITAAAAEAAAADEAQNNRTPGTERRRGQDPDGDAGSIQPSISGGSTGSSKSKDEQPSPRRTDSMSAVSLLSVVEASSQVVRTARVRAPNPEDDDSSHPVAPPQRPRPDPSGSITGMDAPSMAPMQPRLRSNTGVGGSRSSFSTIATRDIPPPPPPQYSQQMSQPGAYRVHGPVPGQYDDVRDDHTLLGSAAPGAGAAVAAVPRPPPSGRPSQPSAAGEQQVQEQPQVTAYLVENDDDESRQTSAELRERLEALTRSVQELALLRDNSGSNSNNNNSSSTNLDSISTHNPASLLGGIAEGPIDPEADDSERDPNYTSAISASSNSHRSSVPAVIGSSAASTSALSSAALNDASSHAADGAVSTTTGRVSGDSSHALSLVEVLRDDRERRQQERSERAERRSRVRKQRQLLERRRRRQWYLIYFVVAVVLGLVLYFVLSKGHADSVFEKFEGGGGGDDDGGSSTTTTTVSGGGSGPPTPTPPGDGTTANGAAPTPTTTQGGEGLNNSTTTTTNTTTVETTTTTTTTTSSMSEGMLPAVMAGGLSTGLFCLALACSFTTKSKVSTDMDDDVILEEEGGGGGGEQEGEDPV